MSYVHLPLTNQVEMEQVFADLPPGARAFVRSGFSVLAKIPESARPAVLQAALEAASRRKSPVDEPLASALGLSVEKLTSAVTALGMLSALVSSRTEPPERLVKTMVNAEIISAPDVPAIEGLIPAISARKLDVHKAVKTRTLADAVLPSFRSLEVALDVRIGNEETAGFAVPVAIAHLRTDAKEQRLWFQLTKEDAEELSGQLNLLLTRFKEAEELIGKLPPSEGV